MVEHMYLVVYGYPYIRCAGARYEVRSAAAEGCRRINTRFSGPIHFVDACGRVIGIIEGIAGAGCKIAHKGGKGHRIYQPVSNGINNIQALQRFVIRKQFAAIRIQCHSVKVSRMAYGAVTVLVVAFATDSGVPSIKARWANPALPIKMAADNSSSVFI